MVCGAASNLCDFAVKGAALQVDPEVLAFARQFRDAGKPMGFICIAPVLVAQIMETPVQVTIGHDAGTAEAITSMGCQHVSANVDEVVVDQQHKIVSTPAYMLGQSISEVAQGIEKCVQAVVLLTDQGS